MKTEIKKITPEMALAILNKNKNNRKLSQKTVAFYVDQMKRGEWKITGQGISIDINGDLLDGQHRLNAIVESGVTIEMLIITDVSPDAFKVYDTGKNRSASDILSINGIKYHSVIASSIRSFYRLKKGVYSSSNKELLLTNSMILDYYQNNKEFFDENIKLIHKIRAKMKIYSLSEMLALMLFYKHIIKIDEHKILLFFEESVGIKESTSNIPKLLSTKLVNYHLGGTPITGANRVKLIKYSISKYLQGINLKVIKIKF